jgi:hypothetical protein
MPDDSRLAVRWSFVTQLVRPISIRKNSGSLRIVGRYLFKITPSVLDKLRDNNKFQEARLCCLTVGHSNGKYTRKKIFSTDCFFHIPDVIVLPDGEKYRPHKRRAYLNMEVTPPRWNQT